MRSANPAVLAVRSNPTSLRGFAQIIKTLKAHEKGPRVIPLPPLLDIPKASRSHFVVMVKPNGIPLDTGAIVAVVLEGTLYGLSVLMFVGTILALIHRRMHIGVNRRMITVACMLLLFSTAHIIISTIRAYEGLVQWRNTFPGGPIAFFADVAQWTFVCKNVLYLLQTLLGDGVVIYRCYVVWQSWWIIIFPTLLWASVAVTGIGCVYSDSVARFYKENIFAGATGPWITAFLAATLFTNILSTSLLAFRIWKVGTRVTRVSSHATVLWPVLRIVLDAGVLYSVSLLAALLCFVAKNQGHYVLIDMIMPIISITFYMVIIRITVSKTAPQGIVSSSGTASGGRLTFSRMSRLSFGARDYRMKRMEVHITQLEETNERGDSESGVGSGEPRSQREKEMDPGKTEWEEDTVAQVLDGFAV